MENSATESEVGSILLALRRGDAEVSNNQARGVEPIDELIASLESQGLTPRGKRRLKLPDGSASQERRCRLSAERTKYLKEGQTKKLPQSLDFRLPSIESAARAEDLVMLWAYVHGKGWVFY